MELFTTGVIIRGAKKRGFFFFVLSNFFPHRSTKKRAVQSDLSLDHVPGAAAVAQKGRSGHNQKLLQALDDVFKVGFKQKHYQSHTFSNVARCYCTSIYISRCFLVKDYRFNISGVEPNFS